MTDVVTCAEMKEIERRADEAGLSYYDMMENAGRAAADIIKKKSKGKRRVLILAGKGNNGGDGYVVARLLKERDFYVRILQIDGNPKTKDATTNYNLVSALVESDAQPKDFDIIVDAIYGTGFHGEFNEKAKTCVKEVNSLSKLVFSLDIPSGLSGDMTDNDPLINDGVHANYTIVFHKKKPVHVCTGLKAYLGDVIVADIGISHWVS